MKSELQDAWIIVMLCAQYEIPGEKNEKKKAENGVSILMPTDLISGFCLRYYIYKTFPELCLTETCNEKPAAMKYSYRAHRVQQKYTGHLLCTRCFKILKAEVGEMKIIRYIDESDIVFLLKELAPGEGEGPVQGRPGEACLAYLIATV